jgi:tetratricopeptide (TPR) repeat protein
VIGGRIGIAVFVLGAALPAEDRPARLSAAVLWFEDAAAPGSSEARHWSYWAGVSIARDLSAVKRLRVLDRHRIQCAFRKLGVKPGEAVLPPIARALGELLEARRVVWGSWRRDGEGWRLEARWLNVGTGDPGAELRFATRTFTAASRDLSLALLAAWGIEPSAEERTRLSSGLTDSEAALESLARLAAANLEEEPYTVQEAHAWRAIEADPRCTTARTALGAILGTQGKLLEAEAAAREALAMEPGRAPARCLLATVLFLQKKFAEAESELVEAQAREPDDLETLMRFAELHTLRKDWDMAVGCLERAIEIDPMNSTIHAKIGQVLASQGKKDQALPFLKEAERLHCGEANTDQMLFVGYLLLGETRLAIERYEALAAWSRRQGVNTPILEQMGSAVEELKARLTPASVVASRPRAYTAEEIDAVLREKFTEEERRLVTAPLASSEGLKARAGEITRDAPDGLAKARALFGALARRAPGEGSPPVRTALEALAAWDDPKEAFVCQDFAKLYVAMARDVGLDAFYVNVEKDIEGKPVAHVCAAVFLDGDVFLPDLTLRLVRGAPQGVPGAR